MLEHLQCSLPAVISPSAQNLVYVIAILKLIHLSNSCILHASFAQTHISERSCRTVKQLT